MLNTLTSVLLRAGVNITTGTVQAVHVTNACAAAPASCEVLRCYFVSQLECQKISFIKTRSVGKNAGMWAPFTAKCLFCSHDDASCVTVLAAVDRTADGTESPQQIQFHHSPWNLAGIEVIDSKAAAQCAGATRQIWARVGPHSIYIRYINGCCAFCNTNSGKSMSVS